MIIYRINVYFHVYSILIDNLLLLMKKNTHDYFEKSYKKEDIQNVKRDKKNSWSHHSKHS